jgi:small subunit ribosomal protein S18
MYRKPFKPKPVKKNCVFCNTETIPDYKNTEQLRAYVSERGKILGRARSGICAKHQKDLTREIKRARHIATLPFVVGI